MNRLTNLIKRFIEEQDGAVVTEYGMLIVVLVMGLVIALAAFRGKLVTWFSSIGDNLAGLSSTSGI
jgi:Flp pilus assembly pilin Flp